MQDVGDRTKRRRLNLDEEEDISLVAQERFLQTAGGDVANADLTHLLLRRRLLAAEQQQQPVDAGFPGARALSRPSDASFLTGGGMGGGDPMVAHLRQNLLNQQLQQAARLQSVAAADDLSILRGQSEGTSSSSLYGSLLGSSAGSHPLADSLLLERVLGSESAAPSSFADQISQRGGRRGSAAAVGPDQIRASYMQSLLDAEREEAAAAAAVAAEGTGDIRRLLALSNADNGGQASILARLQTERAMNERALAAAAMGPPTGFPSGGLQSLISRAPIGTVTAAGATLNRDYLLGRGGPSGPHTTPGNYMGLGGGGAAGLPAGIPLQQQQAKKRPAPSNNPNTTGRQPIHLFMSCDMDDLSPYQCLVRKQIELFEAQEVDAETNARGRNRPIVVGQVGIRCKHCKMLPPRKRERAAIYYPSKLDRLYQAGQTMASVHLGQHCNHIPEHLRQELARLREGKSAALAGKKYWSDGARALGVIEEDDRLFFKRD